MNFKILFVFVSFLFVCSRSVAQAPILGSTVKFIVFTASGAITNTGITHLTGNVGSNVGAVTGFGNVNGVMHSTDPATALCVLDLAILYNQLDTTTAHFFPSASLGGVDTLGPGVYSVPVVATLDSDLVLNGGGDSSAVFIFQLESGLSSTAGVKVKLINGALACNVFWKVEGILTLAAGTTMRGSVIVNNGTISMGSLDTLEGRILTTLGAITLNGVNGMTPLGCGLPLLSGPVAPNLASTACYALFSTTGAVTNVGTTKVRGDVGTNTGLLSGYSASDVIGTIHPVPDSSTAQAAADVLNIFSYLTALPYDIELLYPAQFGNNLLLTPHTYWLGAATTFTDSIFLDAQGNPNAVFVIKMWGALTTSTYSNVKLLNGTKASSVFWLTEGAADIVANSVFNGTILCNSGAFSMLANAKMNGRALVKIGALSTTNDSVYIPTLTGSDSAICYPGVVLPVKLVEFSLSKGDNQRVNLHWVAADESDLRHYEIMRSENGNHWDMQSVIAAKNNASGSNYYNAEDQPDHTGIFYYRLKCVDLYGKAQYSPTRTINLSANGPSAPSVYPNAADRFINIALYGTAATNSFEIHNLFGKTILKGSLLGNSVNKIALPVLDNAMYFIIVNQDDRISKLKLQVSQ